MHTHDKDDEEESGKSSESSESGKSPAVASGTTTARRKLKWNEKLQQGLQPKINESKLAAVIWRGQRSAKA